MLSKVVGFVASAAGMVILSGVVYYGLGWIKDVAGDATIYIATAILVVSYVALVKYATLFPELDTSDRIDELPLPGPTIKSGLYYLLPVIVLVWCLTVERLSPGLSAVWATGFMIFVVITHRPLKAMFRGESEIVARIVSGIWELGEGMLAGARNMIGIGVAVAAAGIIVGTVTLTGIGLVMTEFVEFISGGNLILMLIFTAVICLILGMGLPTTANYIVVSALMAQVIVTIGAENGLIVPLIAVHMFVFYFGILADDTPPVGLAAFAAAAISGGDPIKTGIQGFAYDIRTAILPFMFIFNTELLMIGIEGPIQLVTVVAAAVIAMLVFAAATQGYFLVKNRIWETLVLLLIAFTLFRPGFWMDKIIEPLETVAASRLLEIAEAMPENSLIRIQVKGEDLEGRMVDKVVMLPIGEKGSGADRLASAGIELRFEDGKALIDNIVFGSAAEKQRLDFDWEIASVQQDADRPPKQLVYIPAVIVLGLVIFLQRGRRRRAEPAVT